MESEKLWCKYDSTWEEDDDEEEEGPPEPQERQKTRWIVSRILGSFLWTWLAKVVNWIPWRWFIFTGRKNEDKNESDKKCYQHANEGNVRPRNLRAAQDMQTYRHEYPDLEDEDCVETPNLDFYLNLERFQPNGVKIEELLQTWNEDYEILEKSHSYIQWLFPLREAGMNWCAQPLSRKELEAFRKSDEVKKRFVRAYKLMLNFYGIELVNAKTGELKRAAHSKERFQNLNWHSHNNLRITRILKCLGEMGYEYYQVMLVKFFLEETLVKGTLSSVKQSALDYFLFTVRDRQSRRMLVHYAWQNFNPQDRFVWGPLEKLKRFKVPKTVKQPSICSTTEEIYEETDAVGESAQPERLLETTTLVCAKIPVSVETSDGEVQIKGELREDIKRDSGPAVQDFPEEPAVKNASESKAINHDKVETTVEQVLPVDGSPETSKEVRKRKLSVTEQEEPVKTLQLENPTSNIIGSAIEDFGEECTESSATGTALPALKKKKEDAKEPVNVSLEKEINLSKGSISVPAVKEGAEKILPLGTKDEYVEETIKSGGNVDRNYSDIMNVCAPDEKRYGKGDLSTVEGRLTKIGQESGVVTIDEEYIEKRDIEGYQENADRNEQIIVGDVKTSHEGVEQHKEVNRSSKAQVEKNNIASLSCAPLGKTQDPEAGEAFGANTGKSKEEEARISDIHEAVPEKLIKVCHSVPSKKLTNPDDNASKIEEYPEIGSTGKCTQNEHKPVSDGKLALPNEKEHLVVPQHESGGQAKHDLKVERERKCHNFTCEVGENNGTVEQKECCSRQSADGLGVNKTLTEQVECRLSAPVVSGAERLQSLNELHSCQAGNAASEMKDPFCSTEQEACKDTLAASKVMDKPNLMQLVDCKREQAADEVNESKGMALHHHGEHTQVAKEVEDCSGIGEEQQDCKCEQTPDEKHRLMEQDSLKPDPAAKLEG